MPTAIIFDTEATGIVDPVIIEAAWIAVDSLAPVTLGDTFHQRYQPGKPISLGALATHHIMDEELVDCPPAASFRLPDDLQYLIGHNIDFDWQAVGQPDVKRICTLALARRVVAVELIAAAQGFELRRPLLSGPKLEAEYAKVREFSPPLVEDRSQAAEFEAVAEAIRQGVFG